MTVKPVAYGDEPSQVAKVDTDALHEVFDSRRRALLTELGGLEAALGTSPPTASLRSWWRKMGSPKIMDDRLLSQIRTFVRGGM